MTLNIEEAWNNIQDPIAEASFRTHSNHDHFLILPNTFHLTNGLSEMEEFFLESMGEKVFMRIY